MDTSSPPKVPDMQRLDSVYELKYEPPEYADAVAKGHEDSRDQARPASRYNQIFRLVVDDAIAFFGFFRSLKLEVITFIYMFSYIIRSVSSTTMIIEKVCLVHMGYSEDICGNLQQNITIKTEVEKLANNYHVGHTLTQIVPSAFLACFIGPWSDRYGRRTPIILALIGIILDGCCSIACAAYKYSRVEYYIASALFTGLSGGIVIVLTVVYSCASDTTTKENRTLKYTLLELAFGMGIPIGSLAGGWIYKYSSYVYVFVTSVAGHCFGLIWVILFFDETRGLDNKDTLRVKIASFFTFEAMMDSYRAVAKKRLHRVRLQLALLILAMSITVLTFASTSSVSYMFVYHQYNWGNTKYSTVSAIFSVIGMFALLAAVPLLTKVLKVSDAILGIIGSVSVTAKNIIISFAKQDGLYYLASLLGIFSGMANLAGRSRTSKIVPKSDLGKVFAFVSTAESLIPILGTAVFTQIFNVSLTIQFPGLVFLISGILMVTSLLIFIWFTFLPAIDYDALHEDAENNEAKKEDGSEFVPI